MTTSPIKDVISARSACAGVGSSAEDGFFAMSKDPDRAAADIATKIMAAMVRMPPKPHEDMKLGKTREKPAKSPKPVGAKRKASQP